MMKKKAELLATRADEDIYTEDLEFMVQSALANNRNEHDALTDFINRCAKRYNIVFLAGQNEELKKKLMGLFRRVVADKEASEPEDVFMARRRLNEMLDPNNPDPELEIMARGIIDAFGHYKSIKKKDLFKAFLNAIARDVKFNFDIGNLEIRNKLERIFEIQMKKSHLDLSSYKEEDEAIRAAMINKITKIADELDNIGMIKEASDVDMIKEAAGILDNPVVKVAGIVALIIWLEKRSNFLGKWAETGKISGNVGKNNIITKKVLWYKEGIDDILKKLKIIAEKNGIVKTTDEVVDVEKILLKAKSILGDKFKIGQEYLEILKGNPEIYKKFLGELKNIVKNEKDGASRIVKIFEELQKSVDEVKAVVGKGVVSGAAEVAKELDLDSKIALRNLSTKSVAELTDDELKAIVKVKDLSEYPEGFANKVRLAHEAYEKEFGKVVEEVTGKAYPKVEKEVTEEVVKKTVGKGIDATSEFGKLDSAGGELAEETLKKAKGNKAEAIKEIALGAKKRFLDLEMSSPFLSKILKSMGVDISIFEKIAANPFMKFGGKLLSVVGRIMQIVTAIFEGKGLYELSKHGFDIRNMSEEQIQSAIGAEVGGKGNLNYFLTWTLWVKALVAIEALAMTPEQQIEAYGKEQAAKMQMAKAEQMRTSGNSAKAKAYKDAFDEWNKGGQKGSRPQPQDFGLGVSKIPLLTIDKPSGSTQSSVDFYEAQEPGIVPYKGTIPKWKKDIDTEKEIMPGITYSQIKEEHGKDFAQNIADTDAQRADYMVNAINSDIVRLEASDDQLLIQKLISKHKLDGVVSDKQGLLNKLVQRKDYYMRLAI